MSKTLLDRLRHAQRNYETAAVADAAKALFSPDAQMHLAHPFETMSVDGYLSDALGALAQAWPDLERRDTIVMSGLDTHGAAWVGCCGYWTGTSRAPWLGIPATGHQIAMRFHEFYRIEGDKITEMQALWDIPEVMMQAGVWPMTPSLGREWHVPGPATQDGLVCDGAGDAALEIVGDMLTHLGKFATGGRAAMELEKFWHPSSSWYGPAGIGTTRGVAGFRNWHQIPFLAAMPNRTGDQQTGHLFAQGDYVGFTAWPGMAATITGDGWLGIAPSDQQITMRSLDFWRVEDGMIRENWVLVDLLHVYAQLGVDVLARMSELARARSGDLLP